MGNGKPPLIAQWDILDHTLLANVSCLFLYRYLPLSTLVIRKFIEGTDNEPLANVEFKITDGKDAKVGNGTYYTDKSGEIHVENLEPGMTVTVRETKTVSSYVLDGTPKTAEIPSGDVLEMTFWNSANDELR